MHLGALARHHRPIAVLEIADAVGERRERDRVRAQEHFAVAVADRERRALAGADHQVVLAGEQERQRKRAAQPRQRRLDGIRRRLALLHLVGDEMGDHLGVGFAGELGAAGFQLLTELAEILDDAVVDHRDAVGGVRMGVGFGRLAVGRPAGVADAGVAAQRLAAQPVFEIAKLALGSAARQRAMLERGDARGIVAAVFEPLQRVDKLPRHRLTAENANDPAQSDDPLPVRPHVMRHGRFSKNQNACPDVSKSGHG